MADSEPATHRLLEELREGGIVPEHARVTTEEEVRDALAREPWDAILVDAGSSPATALNVVRRCQANISCLVVADTLKPEEAIAFMRAGAHDVLLRHQPGLLPAALRETLDATERRRAQHRAADELRTLNRALRFISTINQALIRTTDENELLCMACRIAVEIAGYRFAWVGMAEADAENTVRPLCHAGYEGGYLTAIHVSWTDTELGHGPVGTAIRTGQPAFIRDVAREPSFSPWRTEAQPRGYRSVIALPIRVNRRCIGAITLYDGSPNVFAEEEVKLLMELADDISYGIEALRTRERQQLAEDALERERAFLSTAIEVLPIAVAFVSPSHELIKANSACFAFFRDPDWRHWADVEWLTPDHIVVPQTQWPAYYALYERKTFINLEGILRFPDGEEVPVLHQAAPVIVDDELVAAVVVFQDITNLKEADQAKDQFLMILTHEIKTPLTGIIGWAQLAQDAPEMVPAALAAILHNANLQKELLGRLLILTRILTGKLALRQASIDLWQFVTHLVEELQPTLREKELTLILNAPDVALPIAADERYLANAIREVLNNAIQFTPACGRIILVGHRGDEDAVLIVRDTGSGIAPEQLPNLLRPFQQFQRQEARGGLGIGLAIAQGIINAHGARLTLASPGIGKGTTVTIELPLRPAPK